MRGGSQSHLMLGEDGNPYVVKFQNNPQHLRILANEWMATKLAAAIGLTVPDCAIIEVDDWLIDNTIELQMELGSKSERCKAGICFGSRFVGGLMPGFLTDYLPDGPLSEVKNLQEFAGALVFDKWVCNADGRQAVFTKKPPGKHYNATFVDFGYCFNAGEWIFRDSPLRGTFGREFVYRNVTGWDSFEPWLSRVEQLEDKTLNEITATMPEEWYAGKHSELDNLMTRLLRRKLIARELVDSFRGSTRNPFPHWS